MCVQLSIDLFSRRRRCFIRRMKPLLPRKRSSSARINRNRHWNDVEELYYGEALGARVTPHFETLLLHNELNDNAVNEAREAASVRVQQRDSTPSEDGILTPPATPGFAAQSSFNFGRTAMVVEEEEDDLADLSMTPGTPQAWDVFAFPSATTPSDSSPHLRGVSN